VFSLAESPLSPPFHPHSLTLRSKFPVCAVEKRAACENLSVSQAGTHQHKDDVESFAFCSRRLLSLAFPNRSWIELGHPSAPSIYLTLRCFIFPESLGTDVANVPFRNLSHGGLKVVVVPLPTEADLVERVVTFPLASRLENSTR
jgi:hypothetical protein